MPILRPSKSWKKYLPRVLRDCLTCYLLLSFVRQNCLVQVQPEETAVSAMNSFSLVLLVSSVRKDFLILSRINPVIQRSWVQIPPQVEVFGLRPFTQNTSRNPSWWVSEGKLLIFHLCRTYVTFLCLNFAINCPLCHTLALFMTTNYTLSTILRSILGPTRRITGVNIVEMCLVHRGT